MLKKVIKKNQEFIHDLRYQDILIKDDLPNIMNDPEYFIRKQQDTILIVKEITNLLTDLVFEKMDNIEFNKILPQFLCQNLQQGINYFQGQLFINKNDDENLSENIQIPERPQKDSSQSFCIQKIEKSNIIKPFNQNLELLPEDNNNQSINQPIVNQKESYIIQNKIINNPIPLNIKEKTDEQFYQDLRNQKIQKDIFMKNQIQELEEQRKQKRILNMNYNSAFLQDLKEKKFTYGYDGNIIMVNKKDFKKQAQSIKIKIDKDQTIVLQEDLNYPQDKIKQLTQDVQRKSKILQPTSEQIVDQNIYQQQYELFQPQKGVSINLESGLKKQGSGFKQSQISEIDELELTINDKLKMTKKEYKNLNILKNQSKIYDKFTQQNSESFQIDALTELLKNDMSIQTVKKINQSVSQSKIMQKVNNSLQIFDKKLYDSMIQQEKDIDKRVYKKQIPTDNSLLNLSKIDEFNHSIIKNQKSKYTSNTTRYNAQKPIQRLILHKNKKINKSIPLNCAKYPRDQYKEESMALHNQKSFNYNLGNQSSRRNDDRYSFSQLSKQIIQN